MLHSVLAAALIPTAVAIAFKAGHWQVETHRHYVTVTPRPRPRCTTCRGAGGVWTSGPFPEMEACGCWSERRHLRIPLQRAATARSWAKEPSF